LRSFLDLHYLRANVTDSVFAALVADRPEALRLLSAPFRDPEAWAAAADRAASRRVPAPVLDEVHRQARELGPSLARDRYLDALSRPGTTVVATGQQVGLFGGPLYSLHKAATAVARARAIEERTRRPCVPIFWLATEDHDYAEIARVTLPGAEGQVTLELPEEPAPPRVSVAHRKLPPEVDSLLDAAEQALAGAPHAAEVLALLRRHYVAGRPIAAAFAGLFSELFASEGLVVFDPRVPAVARSAAPLFERVLSLHDELAADLATRSAAIRESGFDVQVRARADASLLFFHPEGIEGPRYRLVHREGGFETPAGPVSMPTLGRLLADEPLRFSTSALLRPLLQDTLFPTCAYVGGPAEVSYLAELPPLYERLGVPFPLVAPRARLRLVDRATRSLLERLGISAADAETSEDALLARVAARDGSAESAAELEARLLGALDRELDALAALGMPELAEPIEKTRAACAKSVNKLSAKVVRARLGRDEVARGRVERLTRALYPGGVPQERAYGFPSFAALVGPGALARAVLDAATSFDPRTRDVFL
jgi:bacillithiol biosynthesis cysteine-adding enzyme BshC